MITWKNWIAAGAAIALMALALPAVAQDETESATESATTDGEARNLAREATRDDQAREAEFNRELLTVEEEVNSLKERVFRSKATLQLLAEIVAQGTGTGSRATITHVNGLGRSYRIESLSYYLDGQARFSRSAAEGGLDGVDEIKIFDGPISAGSHSLSVTMQLKGRGGMFSYVDDIGFNIQSNAAFDVGDGENCAVTVEADETGGLSKSFTERPAVTFDVRCATLTEDGGE